MMTHICGKSTYSGVCVYCVVVLGGTRKYNNQLPSLMMLTLPILPCHCCPLSCPSLPPSTSLQPIRPLPSSSPFLLPSSPSFTCLPLPLYSPFSGFCPRSFFPPSVSHSEPSLFIPQFIGVLFLLYFFIFCTLSPLILPSFLSLFNISLPRSSFLSPHQSSQTFSASCSYATLPCPPFSSLPSASNHYSTCIFLFFMFKGSKNILQTLWSLS